MNETRTVVWNMKKEVPSSKRAVPVFNLLYYQYISQTLICSSNSLIASFLLLLLRFRAVAFVINWDCSVGDLWSTHFLNSLSRKFNVWLMSATFGFSWLIWIPSFFYFYSLPVLLLHILHEQTWKLLKWCWYFNCFRLEAIG